MMEKTEFKKTLGRTLLAVGFVRKGQSWYLDGADCVVVLNLQKSDFDEKYYVNLGVWVKSLGFDAHPAHNKCHIQSRLTSLFPLYEEAIEMACRVDATPERVVALNDLMRLHVVPFCQGCGTFEGLRSKLEAGEFRRALVMKVAKDVLGLS